MNKRQIVTELRNFLYEDNLKEVFNKLDNEDSLLELGIIDSVKMIELINFIEKRYKIHVNEDDLIPENFDNINAIVQYIYRQKNLK